MAAEEPPTEIMGEGAIRLAQLKREFPNICFDNYVFPPNLKRIPQEAEQWALDYVHDFYAQYKVWYRAAEKASALAFERAVTIEKLQAELAQKDRIIQVLNTEAESSRKSEIEATKKADEAQAIMDRMKREHYATVEDMGHRNTLVTAERDAALKELNELKSKFAEIAKERDDANSAAQEACEQAVILRTERDAAVAKVQAVETEVEEKVQQAEARLEADIEDLLITYNANVLKHRNLAWLQDYPVHLRSAWERLVEEEGEAHPGESVDRFELENRLLTEDEKKVLHDAIIAHEKEMVGGRSLEVGEGSGVEHHADVTEVTTSPLSVSASAVSLPPVPAYDPERPHLSPIHEHTSEVVQPSASQTGEGISKLSQVFSK